MKLLVGLGLVKLQTTGGSRGLGLVKFQTTGGTRGLGPVKFQTTGGTRGLGLVKFQTTGGTRTCQVSNYWWDKAYFLFCKHMSESCSNSAALATIIALRSSGLRSGESEPSEAEGNESKDKDKACIILYVYLLL